MTTDRKRTHIPHTIFALSSMLRNYYLPVTSLLYADIS